MKLDLSFIPKDFATKTIIESIALARAMEKILSDTELQEKLDQIHNTYKRIGDVTQEICDVYNQHSNKSFRSELDCSNFMKTLDIPANKIRKEKLDPLNKDLTRSLDAFNNMIEKKANELGISDVNQIEAITSLYHTIKSEKPASYITPTEVHTVNNSTDRKKY